LLRALVVPTIGRMTKAMIPWVLAAFGFGCAVAAASSSSAVPAAQAGTNSPRWDYTCADSSAHGSFGEKTADVVTRNLLEFGAEGWELVAFVDDAGIACFKRPAA
jgi:hypothetical protein